MRLKNIVVVDATDMPREVEDYCIEELGVSTHCQNDIIHIENDDNPFANWLRENGYEFKTDSDYIGILSS